MKLRFKTKNSSALVSIRFGFRLIVVTYIVPSSQPPLLRDPIGMVVYALWQAGALGARPL